MSVLVFPNVAPGQRKYGNTHMAWKPPDIWYQVEVTRPHLPGHVLQAPSARETRRYPSHPHKRALQLRLGGPDEEVQDKDKKKRTAFLLCFITHRAVRLICTASLNCLGVTWHCDIFPGSGSPRGHRMTVVSLSFWKMIAWKYEVPYRKLIRKEEIYPTSYTYQFPYGGHFQGAHLSSSAFGFPWPRWKNIEVRVRKAGLKSWFLHLLAVSLWKVTLFA